MNRIWGVEQFTPSEIALANLFRQQPPQVIEGLRSLDECEVDEETLEEICARHGIFIAVCTMIQHSSCLHGTDDAALAFAAACRADWPDTVVGNAARLALAERGLALSPSCGFYAEHMWVEHARALLLAGQIPKAAVALKHILSAAENPTARNEAVQMLRSIKEENDMHEGVN